MRHPTTVRRLDLGVASTISGAAANETTDRAKVTVPEASRVGTPSDQPDEDLHQGEPEQHRGDHQSGFDRPPAGARAGTRSERPRTDGSAGGLEARRAAGAVAPAATAMRWAS